MKNYKFLIVRTFLGIQASREKLEKKLDLKKRKGR
jgi:hypothetical protein